MSAPVASTSSDGRRVRLADEALQRAAELIITKDFSEKRFNECFPTFTGDPRPLEQLQAQVRELFLLGLPSAWKEAGTAHGFVAGANSLDDLLGQAKLRKEMCERTGEKAPNMYTKAADAELTIPSATVPRIREATIALRERRIAMQKRNEEAYALIQQGMATASRTEAQIQAMLDDFNSSMELLGTMDTTQLDALSRTLAETVPN